MGWCRLFETNICTSRVADTNWAAYYSRTKGPYCDETVSGTNGNGYRGCQTKTVSGLTC